MRIAAVLFLCATLGIAQPKMPDVAAQKSAMQKLAFLTGTWTGDATAYEGPTPIKVKQTESVQYKLDGLVMLVEGTGRDPQTGKVIFSALATISYDDVKGQYRFRSFNSGHFLDTELKALDRGFEWGWASGPVNVKFTMKLNDKGQWVEVGEMTMGSNPPRKTVELMVEKQK